MRPLMKLTMYFSDHAPINFIGDVWQVLRQIQNARSYRGFKDFTILGAE